MTIQLRYLQTLLEIGGEHNSTVVFPLPIDLIGPLMRMAEGHPADAEPLPSPGPGADATGDNGDAPGVRRTLKTHTTNAPAT